MTPDEQARLEAAHEAAGLDLGAYIRDRLFGSPGPRSRRQRITPDLDAIARVRTDLAYIGNNLNQLTRAVNVGDLDSPAELDDALEALMRTIDTINAALYGTPTRNTIRDARDATLAAVAEGKASGRAAG